MNASLNGKLNEILSIKNEMKDAITNKGVEVGDAPLSDYPDKINKIKGGVNIDNFAIIVKRFSEDRYGGYDKPIEIDIYDKNNPNGKSSLRHLMFSSSDGPYDEYFNEHWTELRVVNIMSSEAEELPDFLTNTMVEEVNFLLENKFTKYQGFSYCFNLRHLTLGGPGYPVTNVGGQYAFTFSSIETLEIYVSDPENPNIPGAPWSAYGLDIIYLQA